MADLPPTRDQGRVCRRARRGQGDGGERRVAGDAAGLSRGCLLLSCDSVELSSFANEHALLSTPGRGEIEQLSFVRISLSSPAFDGACEGTYARAMYWGYQSCDSTARKAAAC